MIHLEVKRYARKLGLVSKQCGNDDESMPGFRVEFNYPFLTILRWEYELKTPFGENFAALSRSYSATTGWGSCVP